VTDNNINRDLKFPGRNLFVRQHAKISATGTPGFFNKFLYSIGGYNMHVPGGKFTSKPSFTTAKIKDRTWQTDENGSDDGLISNLLTTLNLALTYRSSPRQGIYAP